MHFNQVQKACESRGVLNVTKTYDAVEVSLKQSDKHTRGMACGLKPTLKPK